MIISSRRPMRATRVNLRRAGLAAGWLLAAALAASPAMVHAAEDGAPLQPIVEAVKAEGKEITAEEFNAVIAPFFEVEKAEIGAYQAATRNPEETEGHQLIVRERPGTDAADIVMGFATKDSITGFLTSQDGKLRDVMHNARGQEPSYELTEERRELFKAEKAYWDAWRKAKGH